MDVIEKGSELCEIIQKWKRAGKRIGFVPTMGALHRGHIALIEKSVKQCDRTVCSVFVNPTQFNDPNDLENYPRDIDGDVDMLRKAGCDLVFFPGEREIYPNGREYTLNFDLGRLDGVMEGEFRPGHFRGVAQVVHRFLELIEPDAIYMGLKDFQQVVVVNKLIKDLGLKVDLVPVETVREADGLAMSSRNIRLSSEMRKRAPVIFQTLMDCSKWIKTHPVEEVREMALKQIRERGLEPEYFELAAPESLLPLNSGMVRDKVVACVAAKAGGVRLIDNLVIKQGVCYFAG
ncbi:MAG: pantoate--beta-alanine ligase [Saprospirales bacterium]|nr:MAG: pantoate--beta-alanine ligase [Saprospirales bacterium]